MAPLNVIVKTAAQLLFFFAFFSFACGLRALNEYMNHIPGLHRSSLASLCEKL